MVSIFIPACNSSIEFSVGKNMHDNIDIIRHASPNDIWFHLEDDSSCHVIAHLPPSLNKKQKHKIITQGAVLCKSHSRAKSNANTPICYSEVKNVTPTDIVGTVQVTNKKIIII